MAEEDFYYGESGERIELRPSTRSMLVAYRAAAPERDRAALTRGDERLEGIAESPEVARRNAVVYRRSERAAAAMEAFSNRLRSSGGVRYVAPVYYRGAQPVLVTDEFIAEFKPEVTPAQRDSLHAAQGVTVVQPLAVAPNTFLLRVNQPGPRGSLNVANAYFESGLVRYAQPNLIKTHTRRAAPNDPFFPQQWHLTRIQAEQAWDITRGDPSVVIAVIDDGLDIDHEDIARPGKIVSPLDIIGGDNDPRPAPGDGHGTSVAGVAAANSENSVGVSGIAPECSLMPIRLITGAAITDAQEASAFDHAVTNGAAVISNSWGPTDGGGAAPLPAVVGRAFDRALANGRGGLGTVILFASGNGNESISAAATLDGYSSDNRVIAVAAVHDQNQRSGYSDFGIDVDVCAPSDGTSAVPIFWITQNGMPPDGSTLGITTIDLTGADGFNPPPAGLDPEPIADPNYTGLFGGTSSACPLAAGVVALMLTIAPDLTRDQVQFILEATSDKVDFANTDPVGSYQPNGHSQFYGFGRVNAFNAVRCSRSLVSQRDFVEAIPVTLRRVPGTDRFVSDVTIETIDARRRQPATPATLFIRGGADGFLRAEAQGAVDEVEVD
ncbi:MAG: S8 family serine peptidase [Bryobacteraceae bacterium]